MSTKMSHMCMYVQVHVNKFLRILNNYNELCMYNHRLQDFHVENQKKVSKRGGD